MTKYNKEVGWLAGSHNILQDEDDYLIRDESQIQTRQIDEYVEDRYDQMGLKDKKEREYSFYI